MRDERGAEHFASRECPICGRQEAIDEVKEIAYTHSSPCFYCGYYIGMPGLGLVKEERNAARSP